MSEGEKSGMKGNSDSNSNDYKPLIRLMNDTEDTGEQYTAQTLLPRKWAIYKIRIRAKTDKRDRVNTKEYDNMENTFIGVLEDVSDLCGVIEVMKVLQNNDSKYANFNLTIVSEANDDNRYIGYDYTAEEYNGEKIDFYKPNWEGKVRISICSKIRSNYLPLSIDSVLFLVTGKLEAGLNEELDNKDFRVVAIYIYPHKSKVEFWCAYKYSSDNGFDNAKELLKSKIEKLFVCDGGERNMIYECDVRLAKGR